LPAVLEGRIIATPVPEVTEQSAVEVGQPKTLASLRRINQRIDAVHLPIIEEFQAFLLSLEKQNFGFEQNQAIVAAIQNTASRLRVAFRCPAILDEKDPTRLCGLPAKLRCHKPGRSRSGVIQYEHYLATEGSEETQLIRHGGAAHFQRIELLWADGSPLSDRQIEIGTAG
jgi:hypothetical protein